MSLQRGWIKADNFAACLELLAFVGGLVFDKSTREAFEGGLIDTDADAGNWYSLPLGKLGIDVAHDEEGTGIVFVAVKAPAELESAVSVVLHACASYVIK